MVLSHDRRLVMGPIRRGESFSVVALVPDGKLSLCRARMIFAADENVIEKMHEDSSNTNWTSSGSSTSFLDSFLRSANMAS